MDRSQWTKADLKGYVRANRIGPDGTSPGPLSWCEAVSADRIREVLAAHDEGRTIADVTVPAPDNGIGGALAALQSALSEALARPAGVDAKTVASIAREAVADALAASPARRIQFTTSAPRELPAFDASAQHERFPVLLALLAEGIPVLLAGPRGTGKSEAVRRAAEALGLPFVADSFSMDSGRHDVFGFMSASGAYVPAAFREPFERGGIYCADELDNGTGNLGAAFNLALSNGHAQFPDARVARHADFRFAATANTVHGATLTYNGREAVDGALLDRLAVLDWPIDLAFERRLALAHNADAGPWIDTVQRVRAAADAAGLDRHSPSPRASIYGARMLAAGMSRADALEAFIFRGADADTRARLAGAAK